MLFLDAKMSMLLTSDQVLLQATSFGSAAKKPRVAHDLNVDISSDPNATILKTSANTQSAIEGNC